MPEGVSLAAPVNSVRRRADGFRASLSAFTRSGISISFLFGGGMVGHFAVFRGLYVVVELRENPRKTGFEPVFQP